MAFLGTAVHFVLVYALPPTGVPWPAGLVIALAPIAVAFLVVRHRPGDGLGVVTGILAFFLLLDAVVGLAGRYDLTAGAVAAAVALWWLHRRS